MALVPLAPETRNLIDGKLVGASNGNTFDNVSPSTEEVLGTVADGTKDDMLRAVAAARRAFDETSWSTDPAFRAKCVRQLYEGLEAEKEQFRSIVVHEAGAPVTLTSYMHIDDPIRMMSYWADKASSYTYEKRMTDIPFFGRANGRLPVARRAELVNDLREHIAAARVDRPSQADLRTILDRLGEPGVIAAEARVGEPVVPRVPAPVGPMWTTAAVAPARRGTALIVIVAVIVFTVFVMALLGGLLLAFRSG
jgi:hypothetical protein